MPLSSEISHSRVLNGPGKVTVGNQQFRQFPWLIPLGGSSPNIFADMAMDRFGNPSLGIPLFAKPRDTPNEANFEVNRPRDSTKKRSHVSMRCELGMDRPGHVFRESVA